MALELNKKGLYREFFMHAQVCSNVHSVVCDVCVVQSIVVERMKYDEQITISMRDIKRQLVFLIVYIALCAQWSWRFFAKCLMLLVLVFIVVKSAFDADTS